MMAADYKETRLDSTRSYWHEGEVIRVRGRDYLRQEFHGTIELETLSPGVQRAWSRSPAFFAGLWILFLPLLLAFVLVSGFGLYPSSDVPLFLFFLSAIGLLVAIISWKKTEYATFHSKAGVASLVIGKAGPRKKDFETFVAELSDRIEAAGA